MSDDIRITIALEWDGIIERTEMVNELIITVTQISPHYDSRRRTNYAQKTSLTNSFTER